VTPADALLRDVSPAARVRRRVRTPVLLATAVAWAAAIVLMWPAATTDGGAMPTASMPGMSGSGTTGSSAATLGLPPDLSAVAVLAVVGMWLVMLAAMMAPLLIGPLRHLAERSLPRRRPRVAGLFLAGYLTVWLVAGALLLALADALEGIRAAAVVVLVAVLVWQFSPAKQRCLNRRRAHPALAAFGRRADTEAARFGLSHGAWCVGSCGPAMLLPLVVGADQLAVMAAVTAWLWAEQFDKPVATRWRVRLPVTAARILRGAVVTFAGARTG
jgi:predicted metal-binding membrane protein